MAEPLILLVDDHPENLQVVANILRREGYKIALATSGAQALESIEKKKPDLLLLDIMMPQMDGFEVKRRLNEHPEFSKIPVIFLTALHDSESLIKGFDEGGVDFITKPFRTKELLSRVRTHMELKLSRDMVERQAREHKELLHILCHDLGNPVGNIKSIAQMIQTQEEDPTELAGYIEFSANHCLEVIDLVRQMRALEEKPLRLEPVPIKAALLGALKLMENNLNQKGIQFQDKVPDNIIVIAEPVSLISSVFNNLITNAVKFSDRNGLIQFQCEKMLDQVYFEITDHGVGIPANLVEDLFDLSKATSRPGTEGEQGTGFGMPLVQKFMKAYNGEIEVQSLTKEDSLDHHGTSIRLTFKAAEI